MRSSPSERARTAVRDILVNIEFAQDFVGRTTTEALEADRRTLYAVSRCLEIISEAARRLSADVRDRHPALPWRAIMDLGNAYRHEYDNVDAGLVLQTVRDSLPALALAMDQEARQKLTDGEEA